VLYLVNAAEDPAAASYVDAEMQILGWIASPWCAAQPARPAARAGDRGDRRAALGAPPLGPCVRQDTIAFDAFARCWVQEHVLLDRVGAVLPQERAPRSTAWRMPGGRATRDVRAVDAGPGTSACRDSRRRRVVAVQGAGATARAWLTTLLGASSAATWQPTWRWASLRNDGRRGPPRHGRPDRVAWAVGPRQRRNPAAHGRRVRGGQGGRSRQGEPHRCGRLGALGAWRRTRRWRSDVRRRRVLGGCSGCRRAGLASVYNLARGSDATTVRWSGEF